MGLRGRGGGSVTPRAMTMISRRTADSAGLSRRRIARWRRRGRVNAGSTSPLWGGRRSPDRRVGVFSASRPDASRIVPGTPIASPRPPRPEDRASKPSRGEERPPAMATSAATMRFNAPWFLSIAMFQSIAVAPCRRDFKVGREVRGQSGGGGEGRKSGKWLISGRQKICEGGNLFTADGWGKVCLRVVLFVILGLDPRIHAVTLDSRKRTGRGALLQLARSMTFTALIPGSAPRRCASCSALG